MYPVYKTVSLNRVIRFLLLFCAILFHLPARAAKPEITVAAAANLTEVAQQLGSEFESETGIHPVFSFASTAQLSLQIENAAPFDVFLAADARHVDELDRKGLLVQGTHALYAVGVLALWIPPRGNSSVARIEDLTGSGVRVIALAKPDLAPYGEAAVETLRGLGLWEKLQPKVVYADNISMAKQYGSSGNADAVFTAYSLLLKEGGLVIQVDEKLHKPISQALGIVARSGKQAESRRFTEFILNGSGRKVLMKYGYHLPFPNH